jgi:hypothetical protein
MAGKNEINKMTITNNTHKSFFVICVITFIFLFIEMLSETKGQEAYIVFMILLLPFIALLLNFIKITLHDDSAISLYSFFNKPIDYVKIEKITWVPIHSNIGGFASSIYVIRYLNQQGKHKLKFISVSKNRAGLIEKITKIISE